MVDPNDPFSGETTVTDDQLNGFVEAIDAVKPYSDEITELPPNLAYSYIYTSPHFAAQVIIERQTDGEDGPEDLYGIESLEETVDENGMQQRRLLRFRVSILDDDENQPDPNYSEELYTRATPQDPWTTPRAQISDQILLAAIYMQQGRDEEAEELLDTIDAHAQREEELRQMAGIGSRSLATYLKFTGILERIHAELGIKPV